MRALCGALTLGRGLEVVQDESSLLSDELVVERAVDVEVEMGDDPDRVDALWVVKRQLSYNNKAQPSKKGTLMRGSKSAAVCL
jgi:hypothetical protein